MAQWVNTAGANYIHPGLAQFDGELRLPVYSTPDAPESGAGSKRWNPVTGMEEVWTGSDWVGVGPGDTLSDTYTVIADGSDSVFTWAHGLGFDPTPTGYTIDPQTAPAQGIYSKSANTTHFTVTYDVCPVGTLTFNTTAKQP